MVFDIELEDGTNYKAKVVSKWDANGKTYVVYYDNEGDLVASNIVDNVLVPITSDSEFDYVDEYLSKLGEENEDL